MNAEPLTRGASRVAASSGRGGALGVALDVALDVGLDVGLVLVTSSIRTTPMLRAIGVPDALVTRASTKTISRPRRVTTPSTTTASPRAGSR